MTDALGKIAADVLFLSRPEVAELAEPRAAGRGVSSAMPQKQNPVLSVLVRSAALQAPYLAAQLHLAAANFNDERPDGAWHSEWPAFRQLLRLALGSAGHLRELAEGLQVFPDAMRRNLDLSGPLLLSEGVSAAVAPLLDARRDGPPAGPASSSSSPWWTGRSRFRPRSSPEPTAACCAKPSRPVPFRTNGWKNSWIRPATWARPPKSPAASWPPSPSSPEAAASTGGSTEDPHPTDLNGVSRG